MASGEPIVIMQPVAGFITEAREHNTPVHRVHTLKVQLVTDEVECLSLIAQVLQLYPNVDREWVLRAAQGLPDTTNRGQLI